MDDSFLMRVLDRAADLDEQFQPLAGGQIVLVAVIDQPDPAHQLHHKVRPPGDDRFASVSGEERSEADPLRRALVSPRGTLSDEIIFLWAWRRASTNWRSCRSWPHSLSR